MSDPPLLRKISILVSVLAILTRIRSIPKCIVSPCPNGRCLLWKKGSALTALPLRVAHPQVAAHACGALLATVGAADLLHPLAQGFESGVHLHVTIAHHVGIISTVAATQRIGGFLLKRLADKVKSTSGRSRRSRESRRSGRTLCRDARRLQTAGVVHPRGCETVVIGRLTAGPISPLRPRGPGGPMGPGIPFAPSLPGEPLFPAGPYAAKPTDQSTNHINSIHSYSVCKINNIFLTTTSKNWQKIEIFLELRCFLNL